MPKRQKRLVNIDPKHTTLIEIDSKTRSKLKGPKNGL